jgi:hypothetical protein
LIFDRGISEQEFFQPSFSLMQPTNICHLSIVVAELEEFQQPSA